MKTFKEIITETVKWKRVKVGPRTEWHTIINNDKITLSKLPGRKVSWEAFVNGNLIPGEADSLKDAKAAIEKEYENG